MWVIPIDREPVFDYNQEKSILYEFYVLLYKMQILYNKGNQNRYTEGFRNGILLKTIFRMGGWLL